MISVTELIQGHEELRLKPYFDTETKLTIGWGRNLTDNGITKDEANMMFQRDLGTATRDIVTVLPNFWQFTENRRLALLDAMFALGLPRFLGFRKMIGAIRSDSWKMAAEEMIDSHWHDHQAPARVEEDAALLADGAQ